MGLCQNPLTKANSCNEDTAVQISFVQGPDTLKKYLMSEIE